MVALVTGALLLSSCGENGRYQMVATPEGEYGNVVTYVCDTRTGVVWSRTFKYTTYSRWSPVDNTLHKGELVTTDKNP